MCMFEKEVVFLVDSSTWIESVVRLLVAYVIMCVLRPVLLWPAFVELRQLTLPADAQLCWQDARSYNAQA